MCPASNRFVKYSGKCMVQLVKRLKLEQVVIFKFSTFVRHRHIQCAGAGWKGARAGWARDHSLQYHMYLIPQCCDLKDAVAFVHGDCLMQMVVPKLLSIHDDE